MLRAMWEEMKADRFAHREFTRQMMDRTDDNRERDREDLKEMIANIRTETDAIQVERKGFHETRMAKVDAEHGQQGKTMDHREATQTEPDPGMM
jgi:hypothetical protein